MIKKHLNGKTMNYEKAYKKALERARNLHKDAIDMDDNIRAKQCEIIFHELKEPESERIRKALIRFHKSTIDLDGIKGEDIIKWLEKQGDKTSMWSEEDECYMGECISAVATKDGWSFEEKRKIKHWLESLKQRMEQ